MKFLGTAVAAIEWYDNAICIMFADLISDVFFPSFDDQLKFKIYFILMAIGYLGRPVGAYLFGIYSDKVSRIRASFFSFLIMVLASLGISFLPSYNILGIWAPIIFLLLRFIQGLAIGGNYGASIFTVENAPNKNKYFTSSLISAGFMFGFLLGNLIAALFTYSFSPNYLAAYGWRLALWLNFIFAVPIFYYFPQEKKESISTKQENQKVPWQVFVKVFSVILIDTVPFYIFFVFMSNYSKVFLGKDGTLIWFENAVSMVTMIICAPIFGKLADKYGAIKNLRYVAILLFIISFFAPWQESWWCIIFGIAMSVIYGSLYGWIAMIFPKNVRARASGLTLNIAGSVSAGVTPLVAQKVANYSLSYTGLLLALVSILVFVILLNEDEI